MESIYNIDELINKLKEIRKEKENEEIYIRDIYSTGEYLRISEIWIDEDGDIILDSDKE